MILDIYPQKAQYKTKEKIKLIVELENNQPQKVRAEIQVMSLIKVIYRQNVELEQGLNEILLEGIDTEFGGYGVYLTVTDTGNEDCRFHTAFDVVDDCRKAIRYGFLSDFNTKDGAEQKDVDNLRKFHINMVQYYDWSYRHDNLVSEDTKYRDMMGREVDIETVRKKIETCRSYGMKSLGYGAVYAASGEYYKKHPENALYTSAGNPLVFIDTFYIMNVAEGYGWREHLLSEYAKAVTKIGFDGIHMDTYGFPKTAFCYDKKTLIRLKEEYPGLIEAARQRLDQITKDNYLIFNNVGNWPVEGVAEASQDAVYIEVWEPFCEYGHIKQIILDAKRACREQKPVILAAYLAPFRTDSMERAANAAYLLTAAITVNGAYHLLLGEESGILTQGYYVDYSVIEESAERKLRDYYDFIVQYMELFFDTELSDVTMTHIGWDNTEYKCFHEKWSVDGKADRIWITVREKENRKLISMINLCGNKENEWNIGKDEPKMQKNILLQVQIDKPVRGIYFISPDFYQGRAIELSYDTLKTERGYAVSFEVPDLTYWSNVWIDF